MFIKKITNQKLFYGELNFSFVKVIPSIFQFFYLCIQSSVLLLFCSSGMMRVSGAANPPAPSRDDLRRSRSKLAAALARVKGRKSSRSSSRSSGSSSSDSDSSDSSSSSSRDESSPRRPAGTVILLFYCYILIYTANISWKKFRKIQIF